MRTTRLALIIATSSLISLGLLSGCGGRERPKADLAASQVTNIGVNSYLWRASLDALSFMPLVQADSSGGVMVTDWYVNPQSPGERVKLTVSILDQASTCATRTVLWREGSFAFFIKSLKSLITNVLSKL